MKVLLDENIDVRFKEAFSDSVHEVYTVRDMEWNGLKNGELLEAMSLEQFNILVAVDKNLPYQQNPEKLTVSIFILDVHRNVLANLTPYAPILLEAWEEPLEEKIYLLRV
jgi:predicted nuclease of predicted toxin-antitoxin system